MPTDLWKIVLPFPGCPSTHHVRDTWLQYTRTSFKTSVGEERFVKAEGGICLDTCAYCRKMELSQKHSAGVYPIASLG